MEQLTRNPLQMEMEQTEHESKVNDKNIIQFTIKRVERNRNRMTSSIISTQYNFVTISSFFRCVSAFSYLGLSFCRHRNDFVGFPFKVGLEQLSRLFISTAPTDIGDLGYR